MAIHFASHCQAARTHECLLYAIEERGTDPVTLLNHLTCRDLDKLLTLHSLSIKKGASKADRVALLLPKYADVGKSSTD